MTPEKAVKVRQEIEGREKRSTEERPTPAPEPSPEDTVTEERVRSCKLSMETVELRSGRKVSCIELTGTVDADNFHGIQEIVERILAKEGDEGKYLILNLEGVDYISSAGVGIILSANKTIKEKGGVCEIAGASDDVKKVMNLLGLSSVVVFKDTKRALKKIAKA